MGKHLWKSWMNVLTISMLGAAGVGAVVVACGSEVEPQTGSTVAELDSNCVTDTTTPVGMTDGTDPNGGTDESVGDDTTCQPAGTQTASRLEVKNSSGVSAKLVSIIIFKNAQGQVISAVVKDGPQQTNSTTKEMTRPNPTPPPGTASTSFRYYARGTDGKAYQVSNANRVKRTDGMGNWWWAYPKTMTSTVIPGL
jgi:hypothetical protein